MRIEPLTQFANRCIRWSDRGCIRSPLLARRMVFLLNPVAFCKVLRDIFFKRSRKSWFAMPAARWKL